MEDSILKIINFLAHIKTAGRKMDSWNGILTIQTMFKAIKVPL